MFSGIFEGGILTFFLVWNRLRWAFKVIQDGYFYCVQNALLNNVQRLKAMLAVFSWLYWDHSSGECPGFHIICTLVITLSLNWCKPSVSLGQETQARTQLFTLVSTPKDNMDSVTWSHSVWELEPDSWEQFSGHNHVYTLRHSEA